MSKGKKKEHSSIPDVIRLIVADQGTVSTGDVMRATGVTRQGAHYHLARMVEAEELERRGAGRGRGTRYARSVDLELRLPIQELEEHRVWQQVIESLPEIGHAPENVRSLLAYSFTEMLNNAIDHSGGSQATVLLWTRGPRLTFEIQDDGVGAFQHVRERLGLEDDLAALQQIVKGRETTAPEAHTGEGIFFTSRMVERFELDANSLRLVVDTQIGDHAVGDAPEHPGTRVRCEVDPGTTRTTAEVFADFTEPETLTFSRTVVPLLLFQRENSFVSRSEAKRLANQLDRFTEVTIDFQGVREVGQGFIDQLFRIWAADHPETRLVPINTSPTINELIHRVTTQR